MLNVARFHLAAVFLVAVAACSNVEPQRVTEAINNADGIRYWGSRPYLVVNRPYPIASESVLIDGVVSPDGNSIKVTASTGDTHQFDHFNDATSTMSLLPVLKLGDAGQGGGIVAQASTGEDAMDPNQPAGGAEGDDVSEEGEAEESDEAAGSDEAGAPNETCTGTDCVVEGPESTVGDKRFGVAGVTVRTDNTAQPIFRLNDFVSLTYMQDYSREYVVSTKAGFSIKDVDITYGPGNTLVAMNANVDNSALVQPIVDAWSAVASAGSQALVAAINPGGAAMAAAQAGAVKLQPAPDEYRGQPVTFRLHIVKFASPGVYPIVREEELKFYSTPQAGMEQSVVRPYAPGQVPYRFFELLIAEPLFVGQPLGSLFQVIEDKPKKEQPKQPMDQKPCTAAELMPSINAKPETLNELLKDENTGATVVAAKPKETGDCVEELEITLKLEPADDGQAREAAATQTAQKTALDAIKALFSGVTWGETKLQVTWDDGQ